LAVPCVVWIVLIRSIITAHVWPNRIVLLVSADTFWIGVFESRRLATVLTFWINCSALLSALAFVVIQPFFLEAAVQWISTIDLLHALAFVSSLEGVEITAWILCKGVLTDALRIRAVCVQSTARSIEVLFALALKFSFVIRQGTADIRIILFNTLTFNILLKLGVLTARSSEILSTRTDRMG